MAETELSVLARQGINQHIPDQETLQREVAAWEQHRNAEDRRIDGRSTTADARITERGEFERGLQSPCDSSLGM